MGRMVSIKEIILEGLGRNLQRSVPYTLRTPTGSRMPASMARRAMDRMMLAPALSPANTIFSPVHPVYEVLDLNFRINHYEILKGLYIRTKCSFLYCLDVLYSNFGKLWGDKIKYIFSFDSHIQICMHKT